MKIQTVVIMLMGLLCLACTASAQSSANYTLNWSVMGGGGGEMTSASYAMQSTVGQTAIGIASDAYTIEAGYWYRMGTGPECGDVDDSGTVNIMDVRLLMNNVSCSGYPVDPWAGDVTGNGVIDMADVQLLVAHVFNPAGYLLNCDNGI